MKTRDSVNMLTIGLIAVVSLVGVLLILYCTRWGPWALSDAMVYIVSAKNLLAGHGLGLFRPSGRFLPTTHFPPLFPLVLSAIGVTGIDLVIAARWVNAILFGINILVVGISFFVLTRWAWVSISLSILILSSPIWIFLHSGAMSEPLFIFTGLVSIFLLIHYLKSNKRSKLVGGAIASGLAFITRYIGSAFIIAGALGLLIFRRGSWKRRFVDISNYLFISVLPMLLWLGWLNFPPKKNPPRHIEFFIRHLWDSLQPVRGAIVDNLWGWIPFSTYFPPLHYRTRLVILVFIALALIVLLAFAIRRFRKRNIQVWRLNNGLLLAGLFALFAAAYVAVMVFSYLYIEPRPGSGLGDRMFAPVHLAVVIMIFSVWYFVCGTILSRKWLQIVPVVVALMLTVSSIPSGLETATSLHQNGYGFTSVGWRSSETIQALKEIPSDTLLISNEEEAILLLTGRPAYDIPELRQANRPSIYQRFGDDLDDNVQRIFREDGAALVIFYDTIFTQFWNLYQGSTQQRLEAFTKGLRIYGNYSDGAIYFYDADWQ